MNTYQQLDTFLGGKNTRTVPGIRNTRVQRYGLEPADPISVLYHGTSVVTAHQDGTFTLNSGGYRTRTTRTTKERINAFSPAHVYQFKGQWFLDDGKADFYDGIRVGSDGVPIK